MNTSIWQRPLVVGASGQVGAAIALALRRHGAPTVVRTSRSPQAGWLPFDLTAARSPANLAVLEAAAPDLLVCTGGMTFVDGCERSPADAYAANAHGPAVLAAFAQSHSIPFVFFSTDYVFSGSATEPGPYTEASPVDPLSVYGRSKLEGERLVLAAHPGALVVRTTVVYGPDTAAKNFLYTLLRHLGTGAPLRVPVDQISTPTYNRDLAEAILALLAIRASGVVHVAGPELLDRLQMAQQVAAFFGLDPGKIEGVPTAALGQTAARPLHSGLATPRLDQWLPSLQRHTLEQALLDTEDELRRFLSTLPAAG